MKIIPVYSTGSCRVNATLNGIGLDIVTKYSYQAKCWMIDIYQDDTPLICGVILVPNHDILRPYQHIRQQIGSIVPVERYPDIYQSPYYIGVYLILTWFAPDEEIIIPE